MKKTTLFLFSLFLSIGAMAQIKTDKIYTVVAEGHSKGGQPAWAVNNEKNSFVSTGNTNIGDDTQKHFAFIEFNNATYIYSVFAKKFVKNNATLADVGHAVTVEGLNGGKYLFKFDNDHFINIGGNKQMVIDGWGDQDGEVDGGNTMTLTEVGEFSVEDLYKAIAPLYTPNHTGDKSNTDRKIGSFRVNGDTYSLTDAEQTKKFVDKTSKTFTVEVGSEVEVEMWQSAGSWMNAFVYIDTDNNGFTAGVTNDYVPTGDLVSYSFYNNGASSDEDGWNSNGVAIGGENRNTVNLPSFTAPATPGTYRMRVKYDWCNINPAGDTGTYFKNNFAGHGAAIIDFTLVVESASVISRRVSVVAGAGGSVSIAGETGTEVEAVGGVNIVATPDYGYGFVNWKKGEEIVSTAASYVYNGEEEAEFVAEFRRLSIDEQYTKLSQPTFTQGGNTTQVAMIKLNDQNLSGFTYTQGATMRFDMPQVEAGETYSLDLTYNMAWGDLAIFQIDKNNNEKKYGYYTCVWSSEADPFSVLVNNDANISLMCEELGISSLHELEAETAGDYTYLTIPYEITIDENLEAGDIVVVRVMVGKSDNGAYNATNVFEGGCLDLVFTVKEPEVVPVELVAGKYFRLKGNGGQYLTNDGTGYPYTTTLQTKSEADINTIFYIEQGDAENKFYILSYENGHYVANPYRISVGEEAINSSEIYKQQWEITGSNGVYTFRYGIEHGSGHYMTNAATGGTSYSDDVNDESARWTLEEVTELPVKISAAGWATFYAPVEVKKPEGVKAYYLLSGGVKNGYVTMEEITIDIIPANSAVVLEGEAKEHSFEITNNDYTAIIDNLFHGTVAAEYIQGEAYVLGYINVAEEGQPEKKEVGLYKTILNKLNDTAFLNNGHKAYLHLPAGASTMQNSAGFRFAFGGTTAVEDVEIENEREEIYDLTGRKLECINGAGIYIINGKKVLIK